MGAYLNTKLLILLSSLFFLPACVHRVHVTSNTYANVKSIPNGFIFGNRFAILSAKNTNSLPEQDLILKITRMLEGNNYIVSDVNNADYCLLFNLNTDSSQATEYVEKYVPGQSQTTSGNVYGGYNTAQYNGTTQSSGTTTYIPTQYTLFTQTLHITVYNAKLYREGEKEEVWQGSAVSSGKNPDFREISDYLLTSIFKNFGKDTKKFNVQKFWKRKKISDMIF